MTILKDTRSNKLGLSKICES